MSRLTTGMKSAADMKLRLRAALMSPPPVDPEVITCLIMVPLLFTLFI